VTDVPDVLPPPDPAGPPINLDHYSGQGRPGDYIGPVTGEPAPPTGDPAPAGPVEDYVPDETMVEERPALDRNGLGRALERNYPAVLRDARVSGRVLLEVIVDENGRPRPGSARVIEASHPAFGEAALRAVDRFRFRPAKIGGTPVPVRVTIPIQWTVPN
jgi:protein TonB